MADIQSLIEQLGSGDPISPTITRAPVLTPTIQPNLLGQIGSNPGGLFNYSQLRQVPNVPQHDIERYVPREGVPEETLRTADPSNIKRINEIAEKGADIGGLEWYNMEPLRQMFVSELGEAKGNQQFMRYLELIAATSPRTRVPENIRNASYYLKALAQGEPTPERYLRTQTLPSGKKRADWMVKKETQAPFPYGMMPIHIQNVENILKQGGIPPLDNPKPASFVQNLAGNQRPVTIDTHNMRILGFDRDVPKPNEYGFLEKLQQEQAAKLGMSPAQYQASLWVGGAGQTGVKSGAEPALRHVEKRIEHTAKERGQSKEQVLKDFIHGRASLLEVPNVISPIASYLRSKGIL